jgi:hypothetical protein
VSTAATVPMIAPDGTPGDIPHERVSDAVKSGFKIGAELSAPNGQAGVVPIDRVHDAINAGFMLRGAPVAQPQLNVGHTAGLGTDTGPGMVPNPKTAIAMSGDDPSGFTGEAIAGLTATGTAGTALGAVGQTAAGAATMRALAPIAKRYGIKALEGAGLGAGWELYKELKKVFE